MMPLYLKKASITIPELKGNIFLPLIKEKKNLVNEIIFKNQFYETKITGYKLNQLHRDILDIIIFYGKSPSKYYNRPIRLFSLYEIQKHLRYKSKNNNKWLEEKIKELKRTTISIKTKNKNWIEFSILDIVQYSKKQNKYIIVISDTYMNFFANEISVDYKYYLPNILELNNPQSKALARFLLSYSNNFHINLDKAMNIIGINSNIKRTFNWHRKKILEEEKALESLNIKFIKQSEDNRKKDYLIEYKKLPNIKIYVPSNYKNSYKNFNEEMI